MGYQVEIGISNKHIHLSREHVDILFGEGYQLTNKKDLVQPGQFACEECCDVIGPKGTFKNVRVLGPERPESQVELSMTDCRALGIKAPVRESGVLEGTPGCTLVGPNGTVELERGVIVALRHIHLSAEEAEEAGVVDKEWVKIRIEGERGLEFDNVLIRAGKKYKRECHLDTDEANAAGCGPNSVCEIIKK